MITLGTVPQSLAVIVNTGMAWAPVLHAKDKSGADVTWPTGTTARLLLTHEATGFTDTWVPVVAGALITFNIASARADLVPDGAQARLYLTQGTGVAEIAWLSGVTARRD